MSCCPNYPNNLDKVQRLNDLQGCTKCSSLQHKSKGCKTQFSTKCSLCNGLHLTILCLGKVRSQENSDTKNKANHSNASGKKKKSKEKQTSNDKVENGIAYGVVKEGSLGNDIILPTLTGTLVSPTHQEKVNVMMDTGSQMSFVTSDLAHRFNFRVVCDNISVDVNGFNSKLKYNTKLVIVSLTLNHTVIEFEALCIPKIRTNFSITNMANVVKMFEAKGYKLASQTVDRNPLGVQIIMGVNSCHLLETRSVLFGQGRNASAYLDSPYGVILFGSASKLLHNIDFLPHKQETNSLAVTEEILITTDYDSSLEKESALVEMFHISIDSHPSILDIQGEVCDRELLRATGEILNQKCNDFLHVDSPGVENVMSDLNVELCDFMIENATRDKVTGRLMLPLPWNPGVKHMIGDNYSLSKTILDHNIRKLKRDRAKLQQYHEVIVKQEDEGIIERITNLDDFRREYPTGLCFLPHNGVFRPGHQSTKCRIVFLSNLNGTPNKLSHNQASLPGPNLNHKLTTALTLLRFDNFLITFDLKQAFLQLLVRPEDTLKLLFLWYSDAMGDAKNLVAYRFLRLPFGLRFSPFVLLIALHIILLASNFGECDKDIFLSDLYDMAYMDNLAWTTDSLEELYPAYLKVTKLFGEYGFKLQQFQTNHNVTQSLINSELGEEMEDECKLFGMLWDKSADSLKVKDFSLDIEANTKRLVLSSLHSVFDVFGIYLPVLDRARLFMHKLQLNKYLNWDTKLPDNLYKEWKLIVKQIANCPKMEIKRSFGKREDSYELVCFTDASKDFYGCVLYMRNLRSRELNFLLAKNKIITEKNRSKSMPVLELVALEYGVKVLLDVYAELQKVRRPIKFDALKLFTDSTITLSWVEALITKFDKLRGKSVFIMNRLENIKKLLSASSCGLFSCVRFA